jgi:hypothetical protein
MANVNAPTTLGGEFARALAAKDAERLRELMNPEIDFRGMTPNYFWEPSGREEVLAVLLASWFEPEDEIESLERLEEDGFADRRRVAWRFSVVNPEGRHVVEQQAYYTDAGGQIDWMRVLCSGYRPV